MTLNITGFEASNQAAIQFLERKRLNMLIDDEWVQAAEEKLLEVFDPATGGKLLDVPYASADDVDRAVQAARRAFDKGPWPRMTPAERGRVLTRVADLIERHAEELAELETLDNGKPLATATHFEIPMAAQQFRFFGGVGHSIAGQTLSPSINYQPPGQRVVAYTRKQPIGVVGAIIPWNAPLIMAALKLAPSLASGCTVVLKPAEDTPLTALRLGELLIEAGVPPGVINIVPGVGEVAGVALANHLLVDKITFTGSTAVGKSILDAARGNLKKVSLELGGKSPVIILADADLDAAIEGAASALLYNTGQTCVAGSRLYVHESVYSDVIEGLSKRLSSARLGHGLNPETEIGPLVSPRQADRVFDYIDMGRAEGANILSGGDRLGPNGTFVTPVTMVNVAMDARVMQEEIFGPVIACTPFGEIDSLLTMANDSIYGLAASVWTRDLSAAHRLSEDVRAGTVWVNCHSYFEPTLPVGGFKQSGWGHDSGVIALDNYLETKTVCMVV